MNIGLRKVKKQNSSHIEVQQLQEYVWCEEIGDILSVEDICNKDEWTMKQLTETKVLFNTYIEKIELNAREIVERACEELFENAYDNCNIESLQKVLDKWCKENEGGTITYYPKYGEYVYVQDLIRRENNERYKRILGR